jgi:outer membrane immunogenic protein
MKRISLGKRILLGAVCVSAILFAAPLRSASAADLGLKAPMAPVPQYSWTGFYIGGQGGYGWNYAEFDNLAPAPFLNQEWSGDGGFGGGMIGANYELGASHIVVGVEGEYNGADLSGKSIDPFGNSHSVTLKSFGSAGGRLGFDLTGPGWGKSLLYIVGGAAFGDASQTFTTGLAGPSVTFASGNTVGWAFGAGVEFAVTDHWLVRCEWRMYDFDIASFPANAVVPVAYSTRDTLNTARLGVSYKF